MDTMYTVRSCVTFGGRQRASIMLKSCNSLVHRESGLTEQIPDWWRLKFLRLLPELPDNYRPIQTPDSIGKTFSHQVVVTLRDTDTSGRTLHSSYIRYFLDNISIAAYCSFYPTLVNIQNYYAMRISVVHFTPSVSGDTLAVNTFQDSDNELKMHCFISKDGTIKWYGCLEYYEVLVEPELEPLAFLLSYPSSPEK